MAIAARVVSDAAVAAILATLDMPAERGRAALLDRRHDLELIQAQMSGIGSTQVGSMAMEDVCDLQPRAAHRPRLGLGSRPPFGQCYEPVEWAHYSPDRGIGDASVKRRGVELGMTERTRAIMLTFYAIETEGSVAKDPMLAGAARVFCDTRPRPPP